MALIDKLTAIANAIRGKTGESEPLTLDGMAIAINNLATGGGGSVVGSDAEKYLESCHAEVILPNATSIKLYAFMKDNVLTNIEMPKVTSIGNSSFMNCKNLVLTSLPSGLTSLDSYAFANDSKLAITSLPSGLTSIGDYAFAACYKLTSITFEGKPNSISGTAFNNCVNLTTINVPWAEGEVANAPWGATNATINYNYTGE